MIFKLDEEKAAPGATPKSLKRTWDALMALDSVVAVWLEDRNGEMWQIVVSLSITDLRRIRENGSTPAKVFKGQDIRALLEEFGKTKGLGQISAKYESNGDPGAIGEDSTGGPSYGAYQLASKQGSVKNFLDFLDTENPDFANDLKSAGGDSAARNRTIQFEAAWKGLAIANEVDFYLLQHSFIRKTYYDAIKPRLAALGITLSARSLALRNVAWSVAVQHGVAGGEALFKNMLANQNIQANAKDKDLINANYDERSIVQTYFKSSAPNIQESVKERFVNEREDAQKMLKEELRL